jgi:hypothetical protein
MPASAGGPKHPTQAFAYINEITWHAIAAARYQWLQLLVGLLNDQDRGRQLGNVASYRVNVPIGLVDGHHHQTLFAALGRAKVEVSHHLDPGLGAFPGKRR